MDLANPFLGIDASNGKLPKTTLDQFPELSAKATTKGVYSDQESGYLLRYYFPLKNDYYFKVEVGGYTDDIIRYESILKKLFSSIKIYSAKDFDEIAIEQKINRSDFLKNKVSHTFIDLEKDESFWEIEQRGYNREFTPILKQDEKGRLFFLWKNRKKGMILSEMSLKGSILRNIKLKKDVDYYDFDFIDNGVVFLASVNNYKNRNDRPVHYKEELFVEALDYNGSQKWKTILMPHIVIKDVGQRGFRPASTESIALVSSGENLLAYYSVNGKFDDGIVHQGDAIQVLDKKGNILDDLTKGWYVSHSFSQKAIAKDGLFHLFALGDAYPRGINYTCIGIGEKRYSTFNRKNVFHFEGKDGDNYVGDTYFGSSISDGDNTYFVFSTEGRGKGTKE